MYANNSSTTHCYWNKPLIILKSNIKNLLFVPTTVLWEVHSSVLRLHTVKIKKIRPVNKMNSVTNSIPRFAGGDYCIPSCYLQISWYFSLLFCSQFCFVAFFWKSQLSSSLLQSKILWFKDWYKKGLIISFIHGQNSHLFKNWHFLVLFKVTFFHFVLFVQQFKFGRISL